MSKTEPITELSQNEQISQRKEKLAVLRKQGQAFPNDFKPNAAIQELHNIYGNKDHDSLEIEKKEAKVAGRMMTKRIMGKASFIHIQDNTGRIQLYLKQDDLPQIYEQFKTWDLGDIVGVEGALFKTKTGELTIKVNNIRL
jgi:lysyl-tRNA synthetase class 2